MPEPHDANPQPYVYRVTCFAFSFHLQTKPKLFSFEYLVLSQLFHTVKRVQICL